jgi:hypothetical protein
MFWALSSDFKFRCWMLLTRLLFAFVPLLEVVILGYVVMDVGPPYLTALGNIYSG